jgi:hypothetical protein
MRRVLDHIRPNISFKLWPADAEQFRKLLEQGERKAAIELYFAAVGRRWDAERLWTGRLTPAIAFLRGRAR